MQAHTVESATTTPSNVDQVSASERIWLPVLPAGRVGAVRPVGVVVGGERFVFFRGADGRVAALEDACPHRRFLLSMSWVGVVQPGTITCRYHAWTFAPDGRCVAAVTDGPNSTICNRVRARAYATEEELGLVWVCPSEGSVELRRRADASLAGGRPPESAGGQLIRTSVKADGLRWTGYRVATTLSQHNLEALFNNEGWRRISGSNWTSDAGIPDWGEHGITLPEAWYAHVGGVVALRWIVSVDDNHRAVLMSIRAQAGMVPAPFTYGSRSWRKLKVSEAEIAGLTTLQRLRDSRERKRGQRWK